MISTAAVALTFPFFGYVMEFIGSFLSISVSILFPCFCYLKLKKGYKSLGLEVVVIGMIIGMGFFVAVVGMFTSVREIVKQMHSN